MLSSGHFGWQDSGEASLHAVHDRQFRFTEAEEFAVVASDDREKLLFLPVSILAHEHDDFLPVKRLGWRFGHVNFFAGLCRFHPGFERHYGDGGSVGNAHEPGRGCECIFFVFIGQ